mmetsp:Transcript_25389/g.57392  ORF Transcript_25389/g.57392 Transcript_25389/m.57392 type:complete len:236 (+) Transcript_25389:631-1338(+)
MCRQPCHEELRHDPAFRACCQVLDNLEDVRGGPGDPRREGGRGPRGRRGAGIPTDAFRAASCLGKAGHELPIPGDELQGQPRHLRIKGAQVPVIPDVIEGLQQLSRHLQPVLPSCCTSSLEGLIQGEPLGSSLQPLRSFLSAERAVHLRLPLALEVAQCLVTAQGLCLLGIKHSLSALQQCREVGVVGREAVGKGRHEDVGPDLLDLLKRRQGRCKGDKAQGWNREERFVCVACA